MFCDPHTPPYHALSMPLAEAPCTKRATSAATMSVRMTANRYGSGIRRSTYLTHSAVRDCMTPRCWGLSSSRGGFGCAGSASGVPLAAVASASVASGSSLVALGSSLVVIDLPSPFDVGAAISGKQQRRPWNGTVLTSPSISGLHPHAGRSVAVGASPLRCVGG